MSLNDEDLGNRVDKEDVDPDVLAALNSYWQRAREKIPPENLGLLGKIKAIFKGNKSNSIRIDDGLTISDRIAAYADDLRQFKKETGFWMGVIHFGHERVYFTAARCDGEFLVYKSDKLHKKGYVSSRQIEVHYADGHTDVAVVCTTQAPENIPITPDFDEKDLITDERLFDEAMTFIGNREMGKNLADMDETQNSVMRTLLIGTAVGSFGIGSLATIAIMMLLFF